MAKTSKMIFLDGKEKALENIFSGEDAVFGWIALGFVSENNGFESESDFSELNEAGYSRIALSKYELEANEKDVNTGKVLVKFTATVDSNSLSNGQQINQIAVVDNDNIGSSTKFYCATTFPTFTKTNDSSITFILGFRM